MWFPLLVIPLVLANCPNDFVYEESFNRCYKYQSELLEFYLAEQECKAAGANLVSISNGFENAMVSEAAKHEFGNSQQYRSSPQFWIGANQLTSSNWTWIDGSALNFNNWGGSGQPNSGNGKCAQVESNGYWNAADCSTAAPFVCAVDAVIPTQRPTHSYCESTWTYCADTDFCYRVGHMKSFDDAELDCIENGAHLTSVHSLVENEFIDMLSCTGMNLDYDPKFLVWIGLKRMANGFAWTDGTQVDYLNWEHGQPDDGNGVVEENCVQTIADYLNRTIHGPSFNSLHHWNDYTCESIMRAYVCKKEPLIG